MPPVLYLIDGHALAYRAYFALSSSGSTRLSTRQGEPTAGVFGFASVMIRLLQEKPDYLAVAFDTGKTFRDEIFPEYKGTRAKMPDDLRPQIERIRQMVDTFPFPRLEMEGYEADDVLGSIARIAVKQGLGVKIITGDRDLLQLVDDRVVVNLPGKSMADSRDFREEDVIDYLGVRPDQIIDYKALVGDKSDNIPGVGGVGEKTAISLLSQYGTLDAVYEHIDEITGKLRERLENDREQAYMSRDLATIRTNLPVQLDLEKARADHIQVPAVEAMFLELEFRTLVNRLHDLTGTPSPEGGDGQLALFGQPIARLAQSDHYHPDVQVVDSPAALDALKKELAAASELAFDTETTSTDPMRADLVGISLSVREGEAYYIPVGHKTDEPQLELEIVLNALAPSMTNPALAKIGQNLKYDVLVLSNHGLAVVGCAFDTMIAQWVIDPASRNLGLKEMAADYLNIQMSHIQDLIGSGKNQRSMAQVAIMDCAKYAGADAEVTLRLQPILEERLQQLDAIQIFSEIEMPLVAILAEMEKAGITLDLPFFKNMETWLAERMAIIQKSIFEDIGHEFNLNSTQQLSKALFETLKLEPPDRRQRTASGHFSTAASNLEDIRDQHPVIAKILEHREYSKIKSTYVDALPQQVNPRTGRVHTSFNQTGVVTGRISSSDPNLQNIPTRTEVGRQVRKGFIAAPGCLLLAVDYSQIELRIVAHLSEDEAMLAAFRAGQDIHSATAAAIYRISLADVTKEQRRHAKAINFGLIYGMSAFGLSRGTDLTLAEAEDFVRAYFDQFPGVKKYLDETRREAAETGYVETMLGRRRYFPNLKNGANVNQRNREEREAINAPIQGTAADIIKLAMLEIPAAFTREGLKAKMLLQVHDELVFECPEDEIKPTVKLVRSVMEQTYSLSIPLLTEARVGRNWGELEIYPE